jgi:hypothetical protein
MGSDLKTFPSQFSIHVLSQLNSKHFVVDLGAGNLRDSRFFAQQGHRVLSVDSAEEYIKYLGNSLCIEVFSCDLGDSESLDLLYDKLLLDTKGDPLVLYARFFLHVLRDCELQNFLFFVSQVLKRFKSIAFFEFRGKEDEKYDKIYPDHFRNYIDIESLTALILQLDLTIHYVIGGHGMANLNSEDPFVYRLMISS